MQPVAEYINHLEKGLKTGITTEHSHRRTLQKLLEGLSNGELETVNEPTRIECGAPDIVVALKRSHGLITMGYVETKDVGISLDEEQNSDQLRRYKRLLRNLVLTDYLNFRWFVDGKLRDSVMIGTLEKGRIKSSIMQQEKTAELLRNFLAQAPIQIDNAKDLALRLAHLTHMIRDIIIEAYAKGKVSPTLKGLRSAFAETLLPHLNSEKATPEFADMFAQTLAYGMFAARVNHTGAAPFQRAGAANEIPKINPLLRQLFDTITGTAFSDEPYIGFVDDMVQLLADADINAVLADFGKSEGNDDPVVHFYETYLHAYDPDLRETRGVYYTPEPVVSYIVRSVDSLLRSHFACIDGLADTSKITYPKIEEESHSDASEKLKPEKGHKVLILDPACGTGTFLYKVIELIRENFKKKGLTGLWDGYVKHELLPRMIGFELLMAPYAVAHFKLGLQLSGQDLPPAERTGLSCTFIGSERLGVYLTNTLEKAEKKFFGYFDPLMRTISEEAAAASRIKSSLPILVVMGNPPYSGHSVNKGDWIESLIEDYKKDYPDLQKPGQGKWLHNDYVKFIRFGQWRIERTQSGILAFITDRGYLDNTTFRGMRRQLLAAFSEIYILDLHGGAKKKERTKKGTADENVFDIQQGVCIGFFIKTPNKTQIAKVHYAEVLGTYEEKYEWLSEFDINSTKWKTLNPSEPHNLFVPLNISLHNEYENYSSISEIFSENGDPAPGLVTTHDSFAISWTKDEAENKVVRFLATTSEDDARGIWKLCTQSQWNYDKAKSMLAAGVWREKVVPILYRPFDMRWTVYDSNVAVHRRERVMNHLLSGPNMALIMPRRVETSDPWTHVMVTNKIADHVAVSLKTIDYVFPLYIYPTDSSTTQKKSGRTLMLSAAGAVKRKPNINHEFIKKVIDATGMEWIEDGSADAKTAFGPEDIFAYVYALLNLPSYRSKYDSSLRVSFPRIPPPANAQIFRELIQLGKRIVQLHLMDFSSIHTSAIAFPVQGGNEVEKDCPKFFDVGTKPPGISKPLRNARLYINFDKEGGGARAQYFENIPKTVWEWRVGGYQPVQRWLKERRGRKLTYEDLTFFRNLLSCATETLDIVDLIQKAAKKRIKP